MHRACVSVFALWFAAGCAVGTVDVIDQGEVPDATPPIDAPPPPHDTSVPDTRADRIPPHDSQVEIDVPVTADVPVRTDAAVDAIAPRDVIAPRDTGPACPPNRMLCGTACVDVTSDAQHCGTCTTVCASGASATAACTAGRCVLTCGPGRADCNASAIDGCESDPQTDLANCGACGHACATGSACRAGACVLPVIYANTSTALFRIDAATFSPALVHTFTFPSDVADHGMGDLALTADGSLYGLTIGSDLASPALYAVNKTNAACTLVALFGSAGAGFNGLATVPGPPERLVAISNTGAFLIVNPLTGTSVRGSGLGGATSSGDVAWVTGTGLVATVNSGSTENLATLNAASGAATVGVSTGTNTQHTWGLAALGTTLVGFRDTGDIGLIDRATGSTTRVLNHTTNAWYGAASLGP